MFRTISGTEKVARERERAACKKAFGGDGALEMERRPRVKRERKGRKGNRPRIKNSSGSTFSRGSLSATNLVVEVS